MTSEFTSLNGSAVNSNVLIALLVVAASALGAVAGTRATGTRFIDPLYAALVAGLVTFTCSRASLEAQLILAGLAVAFSRGWGFGPSAAALGVALLSIWVQRRPKLLGALVGALAVQAVLRWSQIGFQGLTLVFGILAIIPVVISAHLRLSQSARGRFNRAAFLLLGGIAVLAAPVALGALLSRSAITRGIASTQVALDRAREGHPEAAATQLRLAATDFDSARAKTTGWWTLGGHLLPLVAQQSRALAGATTAAHRLTTTASRAALTLDYHSLRYDHGALDIARLSAMAEPLATLDRELAATQQTLVSVRSGWVLQPIQFRVRALEGKLDQVRRSAALATDVARVGPEMLGGDRPRHYFVAFMTPAESRGLGGYVGSFGELVADRGRISMVRSGPTGNDLDTAAKDSRTISGPADYLARYGNFEPQNHFGDLSYSPDFPTVAGVIGQMYPQSGGVPLDGVLAIDPAGLAALLSFTGPITVPDYPQPIDSSNAARVLLTDQYLLQPAGVASKARHEMLQEALSVALPKLLAGSLPAPATIAQRLARPVRQGRIRFWAFDPAEQPLLKRLGLDGTVRRSGSADFLAVTTQNGANNKLDPYLQRSVDDRTIFNPGTGQVTSELTIALRNSAPATGVPPNVNGSFAGSGLSPGTNRTWLSIYSPLAMVGATVDGTGSSLSSTPELGVNAYSRFLDIPPGGTVTLKVALRGEIPAGSDYTIQLHLQPLADAEHDTVVVTSPAGWRSQTHPAWIPNTDEHQSHLFRFEPA